MSTAHAFYKGMKAGFSRDTCEELGVFVVLYSMIEYGIETILEKAVSHSQKEEGSVAGWIIADLPMERKLKYLESFLKTSCKASGIEFKPFAEMIGRVRKFQSKRNEYLHRSIMPNAEGSFEMRCVSFGGHLKVKTESLKIDDLKQLNIEMCEIVCFLAEVESGWAN